MSFAKTVLLFLHLCGKKKYPTKLPQGVCENTGLYIRYIPNSPTVYCLQPIKISHHYIKILNMVNQAVDLVDTERIIDYNENAC